MSGSHSPHSSLSTPTMHSTTPAIPNTHTTSDGGLGKYTSSSTSPSFASVVSSSAPAIPVSPSSFSSNSAPLGSTSAMLSSSSRSQHQHQKHGQTSPPSAVLSSNYNIIKNSASLPAPSSVTSSTSQSNRSPTHTSSSDSALTSPASRSFSSNQSSNSSTGLDQSNSDSSDVEIYLDTLVLHGSVTRIHGMYLSYSAHHDTRPLFFFQHSLSVSAYLVFDRGYFIISFLLTKKKFAHIFMITHLFSSNLPVDATRNDSTHLQPPPEDQTRSAVTNELSVSPSRSHISTHDQQQHPMVSGESASPGTTSQTTGANPQFGLGVSDGRNPNDTKSAGVNPGNALSPLPRSLSLSSSPSQLQSHSQHNGNGQQYIPLAKSPQNPPPAPVQATIPLPEVDECEYNLKERAPYVGCRQFQRQYHVQERGYGLVQENTIDLASFNVSTASQQQTLGVPPPTSPNQLLSSPSDFGITPSSTTSSGFDVASSTSTAATTPALGSTTSGLCVSESNSNTAVDAGTLSLLDSNKTPNVYINGLPPHFPEDQLFALASPFGEIRSVRTFTRHVRDSESGYGFVL